MRRFPVMRSSILRSFRRHDDLVLELQQNIIGLRTTDA